MYDDQPRYLTGPSRKRSTKDPFAARLGLIVLGFILLLPIALILRPGNGGTVTTSGLPGGVGLLQPVSADAATSDQSVQVVSAAGTDGNAVPTEAAASSAGPVVIEAPVVADVSSTAAAPAPTPADDVVAAAPTEAVKTTSTAVPSPALSAAKRAPSTTSARATTTTTTTQAKTVSKKSVAPATTTPPTTKAPTKATTTKAPTTTAPTTTAAPKTTTTRPKPVPTTTTTTTQAPVKYTSAQIVAIISSVWPADLQTKALAIALRESNNQPTAVNYCCYGLFQINYPANQAWLNSVGISNPIQLFDPKTNASIALLMYQRSGWAPWGG